MLLYHVKHPCPDIANSVHELSKVLDGAFSVAFKEIICDIKFFLDKEFWFEI